MSGYRKTCVSIIAVATVICSQAAYAQQNSTASENAGEGGLEEIIVTAQKRAENLQRVPVAVTALTAQSLQTAGVGNVLDLNRLTPSANTSNSLGFVKPFIRGIGSSANGAGVESAVSIYVDGVYYASTPASAFSFDDVQRVEVLKGPQGTLFGRNAVGGLIQVVTSDPGDKLTGRAEVSYGNYDIWKLKGFVSAPLSDAIGFTLAAQYTKQGKGFGTNFFDGKDANFTRHDFSVRGKLVLNLGSTKIKLSGDYADRDAPLFYFRMDYEFPQLVTAPIPSGRPWDANTNAGNTNTVKGGGGSLRLEHEFDPFNLLSITAYRQSRFNYVFDPDLSPLPTVAVDTLLKQNQFTQELQLQSKAGSPFDWTLGAFYYKADEGVKPNRTIPGFGAARFIDNNADLSSESLAGFGQLTVPITDRTRVTGGIRYTWEKRTVSSFSQTTLRTGTVLAPVTGLSQQISFNRWTWRLALDHRFSDDVMGYASYNRGFKSGGFAQNFPNDAAFLPESIDAYEVGLKTELFDRRVRLNLSAYLNDLSNRQLVLARLGAATTSIINAASSRSYGIEAELTAALGDHLTVNSGIGLMHSTFTSFLPPSDPAKTNCTLYTAPLTFTQSRCNLAGFDTPNSPRVTFNLGANWHQDVSFGKLLAGFNYGYNGGFFFEGDNLARQKPYHLLSLNFGWSSKNDMFTLKVWGDNIFNEVVRTNGQAGTNGVASTYQAPATYGITAAVRF